METLPFGFLWPADAIEYFRAKWLGTEAVTLDPRDRSKLTELRAEYSRWNKSRPTPTSIGAFERWKLLGGKDEQGRLEAIDKHYCAQQKLAKASLAKSLGAGFIEAKFIAEATGLSFPTQPSVWFSDQAPNIWAGKAIVWRYSDGPLWQGHVIVSAASIDVFCERLARSGEQPPASSEPAPAEKGETQQRYILRALIGTGELRAPALGELRPYARAWLRANRPENCDDDAVTHTANSMAQQFRKLLRAETTRPRGGRTKSKRTSKAKPTNSRRTRSE